MSASPALASFEAAWTARQASPGAASPLQELRAAAMARFNRLGLPTMRDESWHYSNLRALALRSFHAPDIGLPAPPQEPGWLQQVLDAQVLNLVNGVPAGALPSLPGVTLQTLAELERSDPARLLTLSPPASDAEEQRWLLLNTALYENGLSGILVKVSRDVTITAAHVHHNAYEGIMISGSVDTRLVDNNVHDNSQIDPGRLHANTKFPATSPPV